MFIVDIYFRNTSPDSPEPYAFHAKDIGQDLEDHVKAWAIRMLLVSIVLIGA